ncbi:hypothetical protein SGLAM104S_00143 [Streptomyces glaucescens]
MVAVAVPSCGASADADWGARVRLAPSVGSADSPLAEGDGDAEPDGDADAVPDAVPPGAARVGERVRRRLSLLPPLRRAAVRRGVARRGGSRGRAGGVHPELRETETARGQHETRADQQRATAAAPVGGGLLVTAALLRPAVATTRGLVPAA